MAQQEFKIDGVTIKRPSSFKIERYNVTNLDRRADAKMVGDLIAKKRKFYFTYAAITARELNVILDAIWETNSLFFTLTYIENNVTKTVTVYSGSIPSELHMTGSNWVWKNVTFDLIEQ
jgi:hypothetical protein